MIKGKTKKGFDFQIDEKNLDDWEILEVLSDIDNGKETLAPKAIRMLLGNEQYQALKDFLRKDGKVSIQAMLGEFTEIMNSSQELKN